MFNENILNNEQLLIFVNEFNLDVNNVELLEIFYTYFIFVLSLKYPNINIKFNKEIVNWLKEPVDNILRYEYHISNFYKINNKVYNIDYGDISCIFDLIMSEEVNQKFLNHFISYEKVISSFFENKIGYISTYCNDIYLPTFIEKYYLASDQLEISPSKKIESLVWLATLEKDFFLHNDKPLNNENNSPLSLGITTLKNENNFYYKPRMSEEQIILLDNFYNINLEDEELFEISYTYFIFVLSVNYPNITPFFSDKDIAWLKEDCDGIPRFVKNISQFKKINQSHFDLSYGLTSCMFDFIMTDKINFDFLDIFISSENVIKSFYKDRVQYTRLYIENLYIPNFLNKCYTSRKDLNNHFKTLPSEKIAILIWFVSSGISEIINSKKLSTTKESISKKPAHDIVSQGVNIIGFHSYSLGIGEDARLASLAFSKVINNISNTEPQINITSQKENITEAIFSFPKYKTNIFYLPANECLSLYLSDKETFFNSHYNICNWQWELPFWPKKLDYAFSFTDEIWAPTNYIKSSIDSAGKQQSILMPMPVILNQFDILSKEHFNLNTKSFSFLFVFDGLSWPQRKNPYACIEAFKIAFKNNPCVELIIKTMNLEFKNEFYTYISKESQKDPRIKIINEHFDKNKLLALFNSADAYVSLHRAEGFGRTIAEAMLLQKPIVVSNYSGSCDFCNSENSFLVDGALIDVGKYDYHYSENQMWFDPDIDDAAHKMKLCYDNKALSNAKAHLGKETIEKNYSLKIIASNYKKRLLQLGIL